ncbi:hypothetical protein CRENBAI_023822 [Crenichthys baileyi]|uniref:Uncharacterized protein n=1 Tax=Crenichthys baileyi TaxID=28760 RepID=A0AAV9S9L6_9TELE
MDTDATHQSHSAVRSSVLCRHLPASTSWLGVKTFTIPHGSWTLSAPLCCIVTGYVSHLVLAHASASFPPFRLGGSLHCLLRHPVPPRTIRAFYTVDHVFVVCIMTVHPPSTVPPHSSYYTDFLRSSRAHSSFITLFIELARIFPFRSIPATRGCTTLPTTHVDTDPPVTYSPAIVTRFHNLRPCSHALF